MEPLEDDADVVAPEPGAVVVAERPEVVARHLDAARGGAFQPARNHHQARLAGPRRPDNRRNLAGSYVERNTAQDIDRAGIACHVEMDVGEADNGGNGGGQESSG